MSLKIEASEISNRVTFTVSKQSLNKAKQSIKEVTDFSNKQKLFQKPFQDAEKAAKKAAKQIDKALKAPRSTGDRKQDVSAAKAKAAADKAAAKAAQMQERADLKVLSTVSKIKEIQGITNHEALQYATAAKMVANEYQRGEKSLQRMNHDMQALVKDAKQLGKANQQAAQQAQKATTSRRKQKNTNKKTSSGPEYGIGAVTGYIGGAFAAEKIASTLGHTILDTGNENLELVRKSKAVGTDANAVKTLVRLSRMQGVDANTDTITDNLKDIQERIGDSLSNSQIDAKTGLYKGGDNAIDTILNKLHFNKADLKRFSKSPIDFFNEVVNRGQKAGLKDNEIQHLLEDTGNDLFYLESSFKDGGKAFKETFAQLRDSGQLLTDEQLAQVEEYGKLSIAFDNLQNVAKQNLFTGWLQALEVNGNDLASDTKEVGKVAKELGSQLGDLTNQIIGFVKEVDHGVHYLQEKFPHVFGSTAQETYNKVSGDSANATADFIKRHTGFDTRSVGASLREHLGMADYADKALLHEQYGSPAPTAPDVSQYTGIKGSTGYSPASLQRVAAPVVNNVVNPAPVEVVVKGADGIHNLITAEVTRGLDTYEANQAQAFNAASLHAHP
jgi:hypothetical protein